MFRTPIRSNRNRILPIRSSIAASISTSSPAASPAVILSDRSSPAFTAALDTTSIWYGSTASPSSFWNTTTPGE
ncbi:hypothetical protein MD484_g7314, partial [Candolleomyces efflorescens]